MTIQKAAHNLLTQAKRPMAALDVATLALEQGLVHSNAKRPAYSLAQTIEKNIRDGSYNEPELKFIHEQGRRMIALPEWEDNPQFEKVAVASSPTAELSARIRSDLLEQVQLAAQSKIAESFDNTVALLLRRGLSAEAANIREALMKQLKQLNASGQRAS